MAQGGKSHNDRVLAARVRTKALKQIETILDGNDEKLKEALILKLAPTLLPRLNEHTGEDGEQIELKIVNYGDPIVQVPGTALPGSLTASVGQGV